MKTGRFQRIIQKRFTHLSEKFFKRKTERSKRERMSDDEREDGNQEEEEEEEKGPKGKAKPVKAPTGKKFEVKKWNAVALWAWGKIIIIIKHKICKFISKG